MNQTGRARRAVSVGVETWQRARDVDALLAAAGVAFFALLSVIPAMARAHRRSTGCSPTPSDVANELDRPLRRRRRARAASSCSTS